MRMFALMGRKGLPVVIKNGFEGTNFDATALRHLLISMNLSVFLHLSLLIFLFLVLDFYVAAASLGVICLLPRLSKSQPNGAVMPLRRDFPVAE